MHWMASGLLDLRMRILSILRILSKVRPVLGVLWKRSPAFILVKVGLAVPASRVVSNLSSGTKSSLPRPGLSGRTLSCRAGNNSSYPM